jgi:hypothetical protein
MRDRLYRVGILLDETELTSVFAFGRDAEEAVQIAKHKHWALATQDRLTWSARLPTDAEEYAHALEWPCL